MENFGGYSMVDKNTKERFVKEVALDKGYFVNDNNFRTENGDIIHIADCRCVKEYADGGQQDMSVEYRDSVMDRYANAGQEYKLYEYCVEARDVIHLERRYLVSKIDSCDDEVEKVSLTEYLNVVDLQLERIERTIAKEEELMVN